MSYNSKYKGEEVEEILDSVGGKVDKVDGKQLSTEDFTTALKNKLNGLSNYDDTEISQAVEKLRSDFDTLVNGDTTTAIKSFNEIISFLDGIEDSESLDGIIASIEQQIAAKYAKPSTGIPKSDLESDVQESLNKADTALQSYTEQYKGTVTGVKMNGTTKSPSDGVVDLGTVITELETIGTAGTFGPSADVEGVDGSTINVPQIKVDAYGRVTSVTERTYTSVDNNTTYSVMTASQATTGTSTTGYRISPKVLHDKIVDTSVLNDSNILRIQKVTALPSSPDANTLYIIV